MGLLRKAAGPLGLALTAGQAAWIARTHWQQLPAAQRIRLQTLLKDSRGRLSNLTAAERRELSKLVSDLQLGELGRDLAGSALGTRIRGRKR
ncbi:MAG TPA: hypothetical protein VHE14_07490 [Solirubrobacteraceae bacterium]|nr:hypothetical protein [Solirubrobacteraceae bacterium]